MRNWLLGAVAVLVIALVFVASRPGSYAVEREAVVTAPLEVVYAQLADLHRWPAWSPWQPVAEVQQEFGGSAAGQGARLHFTGRLQANGPMAEGELEVLEAVPSQRLVLRLTWFRPSQASVELNFALKPESTGARVVWQVRGRLGFGQKLAGLLASWDDLLGPDLERGLRQLDAAARRAAREVPLPPTMAPLPPTPILAPYPHHVTPTVAIPETPSPAAVVPQRRAPVAPSADNPFPAPY
jgi:uncharacterized protein YndB with AHSA1/START domain